MALTEDELRSLPKEDLGKKASSIRDAIMAVDTKAPGARARLAELNADHAVIQRVATQKADRLAHLRRLSSDPGRIDGGVASGLMEPVDAPIRRAGERAARGAIEKLYAGNAISERAALWGEQVTTADRFGTEARYIAAVADPNYLTGFWRMLSDPMAPHSLSEKERTAVRRVSDSMWERAMSVGTGSAGGFAVPYQLDPTLIATSDGALNPLRQVARVVPAISEIWKGVTADAVSSAYYQEAAEVADDTPTLGQPTIYNERGSSFVPFSIEVGMDWGGLQSELVQLLTDAKDLLEATKFLSGAGHGSFEPSGILIGATHHVDTAASNTFALGDVYGMKEALGPRFQPGASWLAAAATYDRTRRFVGPGSAEPSVWDDAGRLLSRPAAEYPSMSTDLADGTTPLLYGDFRQGFVITERIGMVVEIVAHLFGNANRPTGQRGLFAWWRNGSGVVNSNAIRVLRVKS